MKPINDYLTEHLTLTTATIRICGNNHEVHRRVRDEERNAILVISAREARDRIGSQRLHSVSINILLRRQHLVQVEA